MEIRPCITPRSLRRLYRVLIPEPALCKLKASPVQVVGSGISLATLGVAPVNVRGLIPGPTTERTTESRTWDQSTRRRR